MKKTIRTLTVMVMAILMLTIATIPAMAAGFDFESAISDFVSGPLNTYTLEIGEKHAPGASVWTQNGMAACYSSDETVVTVSDRGTVTAVGEGTAYIAITAGGMYQVYRYDVVAEGAKGFGMEFGTKFFNIWFIIVTIIVILALLLTVAAVIYIYIAAPKCGMSRLWALIPLFSSFIGLIVFIVVRSNRKAIAGPNGGSNTVACPTCGGVHPAGTTECPICGSKLQ